MIWNRLKSMLCPKCNTFIKENLNTDMYECMKSNCDFKISKERFDEVVNDLYRDRTVRLDEDNLSELNNL